MRIQCVTISMLALVLVCVCICVSLTKQLLTHVTKHFKPLITSSAVCFLTSFLRHLLQGTVFERKLTKRAEWSRGCINRKVSFYYQRQKIQKAAWKYDRFQCWWWSIINSPAPCAGGSRAPHGGRSSCCQHHVYPHEWLQVLHYNSFTVHCVSYWCITVSCTSASDTGDLDIQSLLRGCERLEGDFPPGEASVTVAQN